MSTLVNLTRQGVTLQGFRLVTRDDMWTAFCWLTDNGYRGNINAYGETAPSWNMSFARAPAGDSQVGYLGDWIVLEAGTQATIYTETVFNSLFTVT